MSTMPDPKMPGDFLPLSDEHDESSAPDDNDDTKHDETNLPPAPP